MAKIVPAKYRRFVLNLIKKYIGCFEGETTVTRYSVPGDLPNVTLTATADLRVQAPEKPFLSNGQWAYQGGPSSAGV